MPIPLARWREANASATVLCECGAIVGADDGDDLIERFALHLHDCALGRDAAASEYVARHAERD